MDKKVIIIENQYLQFFDLHQLIPSNTYTVYPGKSEDEFITFMDYVRVWINEQYDDDKRQKCLDEIVEIIVNQDANLIIMDHILGGPYHCLNGIHLATKLNKHDGLKNIPILFLSKSNMNKKKNDKAYTKFLKDRNSRPTVWISKGYLGYDILEEGFFKKNVLPKIEELTGIADQLDNDESIIHDLLTLLNETAYKVPFKDLIAYLTKAQKMNKLSAQVKDEITMMKSDITAITDNSWIELKRQVDDTQ